jgi:signal transduction histidine kinase
MSDVPGRRILVVDDDEQGVGLGLVLARDVTTAMNGRLDVDSVAGAGTTVAVVLPAGGAVPVAENTPRVAR